MRELLRVALQQVTTRLRQPLLIARWRHHPQWLHRVVRPAFAVGRQVVAPAAPAHVPSTSGQADVHSSSSVHQAATSVTPEPVPSSSRQDTGMVDPPWPTTDRLMETSTDLSVTGRVNEEIGLSHAIRILKM